MNLFATVIASLLLARIGYEHVPWWGNLLIALWIWCFGANVGSFMNVVIFRVPAGLSVVYPGSRCPKCLNHIAWYDNIPMLSWLWLRARCRYCALPISSRYPTIEAMVAAIFLLVAIVGPPTGGQNLPHIGSYHSREADVALWLVYAYHMLLVTTLICAAAIRFDGHRPPFRLYLPALVIGILAPVTWAGVQDSYAVLHPVAFHAIGSDLSPTRVAAFNVLCGLVVAAFIGMSARGGVSPQRNRLLFSELPAVALCGIYLGWQAAASLGLIAATMDLLTGITARKRAKLVRIPWTAHLVFATVIYIVFWGGFVKLYGLQVEKYFSWLPAGTPALALIPLWGLVLTNTAVIFIGLLASFLAKARPPVGAQAERPSEVFGANLMNRPIEGNTHAILNSPSYRLAEEDTDFLKQDALRPVRVQLELLKPEMTLAEHGVRSTIVAFGGTQIVEQHEAEERLARARQALAESIDDPQAQRVVARAERVLAKSKYYDAAREFSRLVSSSCQTSGERHYVITTGGGPGVMEAANRGAYDVGAKSIGLNITLPHEQAPNPYITPELCFQFHYFALRKMHFLFRAKALVVFPGGFGTLDELFDALTLRQTERMQAIPIILFGREYWSRVIDFQFLADEGVIADEHLDLIDFAETPQEAWDIITRFHGNG